MFCRSSLTAMLVLGAEVLKARNQLCTATELVAVEGNPFPLDVVAWGPGCNRAVRVTRDGTTTGIADARHWHTVNLEVGGTAANHLAAVGGGVA